MSTSSLCAISSGERSSASRRPFIRSPICVKSVAIFFEFNYSFFELQRYLFLKKQVEAHGHHCHSYHQPDDGEVVLPIFLGTGQQLIERYIDHDTCHSREDECIELRRPVRQ